jgi:TolB protein
LEGNFSAPYWISGDKVIAIKGGDDKSIYKIDPQSMTSELYSSIEDTLDLKVSPDGQYGIYVNTKGQLMLMTLNPGFISTLSTDTTTKTDLTWSADSKKVYFTQGDNQDKISYIDLATAAIKTVLEDKINFKSDIHLSPDGTKVLYNQNITGTATNDADATEDSLKVDFSKAGAQLCLLDLATDGAKPVKLTDGKSNTYNASVLNDGSAVYVNVDPADTALKGTLKQVSPAGVIKDLVADIDVTSSVATAAGSFIITGTDAAGKIHVATVTADGKKTDVVTSDTDVLNISSSTDGASIFATIGGKLVVIKNGSISYLTK